MILNYFVIIINMKTYFLKRLVPNFMNLCIFSRIYDDDIWNATLALYRQYRNKQDTLPNSGDPAVLLIALLTNWKNKLFY